MSQELIYTSAPRGLKPGSQGFCTVVSTQGISASLVQRLEALSGYRHVFPPPDPNAHLNPVLFSHLIVSVAGRPFHVLSRVCDAGLDHTQRTNKFAHHVVLDPRERVPGGPAWLLAAPGFMQSAWDGVPRVLPAGRRPPPANSPAAICRAWQQATGDAGWGGALAETAGPGVNRPAVIVFRPGIDPLPLLAESLALLPPGSRWGVSFCTYFNKLPPGIDCQWRCVLEGSPEAIANQRLPGALVIDLGKPGGAAPDSPLVQAARTGVVPLAPAALSRQSSVAGANRASDAELARLLSESASAPPLSASVSGSSPQSSTVPAAVESSGAEIYELGPLRGPANALDFPPQAICRPFKRKPKSKWPFFAGMVTTVAILVLATVGMYVANTKRTTTPLAATPPEQKQSDENARADLEKSAKELEDKAVAAMKKARLDAQNASDATARTSILAGKADASAAEVEARMAVAAANRAKLEADKASTAAKQATDLLSKAPIEPSPRAGASEKTASNAAGEAASSAKQAKASSERANDLVEKAKAAREKLAADKAKEANVAKTPQATVRPGTADNHPHMPNNPAPRQKSDSFVDLPEYKPSSALAISQSSDREAKPLSPEDFTSLTTVTLHAPNASDQEKPALFKLTRGTNKTWKCSTYSALNERTFASFTAGDKGLSFRWIGNVQEDDVRLRDHFLFITMKDKVRVLALREPERCARIPLALSSEATSLPYSLTRYGIPGKSVYSVALLGVTNNAGKPIGENVVGLERVPDSNGTKVRLQVGTSQAACFSIALEKRTEPLDLVVVIKYEGLLLENRGRWKTTEIGKRWNLAEVKEDNPVLIYRQEITDFLDAFNREKEERKTKEDAWGKAREQGQKKRLKEQVDDLAKNISSNFAPVEAFANDLRNKFCGREGMTLQFRICVRLCDQQIDLYKSQ